MNYSVKAIIICFINLCLLSLFLPGRVKAQSPVLTNTPIQNEIFYENDYLRVWDTRFFNGIIDLFYKKSNGQWEQYNNLVPIAKVNNIWNNAEIENSIISREIINSVNPTKIKFQFTPLSNGAHFCLLMEMEQSSPFIKMSVIVNNDSLPIQAFALGNYYGYHNLVRFIKIDDYLYDVLTYPQPQGGNYQLGDFYALEIPASKEIIFWGEGKVRQKQFFIQSLSDQDVIMTEVRYFPWLPEQPSPNRNWFETIHLTREPLTIAKADYYFGIIPLLMMKLNILSTYASSQVENDLNSDGKVNLIDLFNSY